MEFASEAAGDNTTERQETGDKFVLEKGFLSGTARMDACGASCGVCEWFDVVDDGPESVEAAG